MEKTLIIILVAILAVCLTAVVLLALRYKKDQEKWKVIAEENIRRGKEDAADILRRTIDKVQDDKTILEQMTEKELLIETVLGLAGYGRRLDRIEEKIAFISNYKEFAERVEKQLNALEKITLNTQKSSYLCEQSVKDFCESIQNAKASIENLDADVKGLEFTKIEIHNISEKMSGSVYELECINKQVEKIICEMNKVFEIYSEAPMVKINKMNTLLLEMGDLLESFEQSIDEIEDDTDSIRNQINEHFDQYGYDNVYSKLNDINNNIKNLDDSMESMTDRFAYESPMYKINEINDKLNSLINAINN